MLFGPTGLHIFYSSTHLFEELMIYKIIWILTEWAVSLEL